jgi:iron complex outermembrane receptor protein
VPLLTEFGDNLQASSLRLAGYAQDEWGFAPQWAVHAGLRWEGITTRGDAGDGQHPENRSSVWTPLVHLLWKREAPSTNGRRDEPRDQVRLSLTRSYRSPAVSQLIARPSINGRYPPAGPNEPTSPDSAGNPELRPELAGGIDLAFERYLSGGGLLSMNLFHRGISDLIRNVTTLEDVSWSPVPRWVSRPQNIGSATTQGIEMEAKYRLDQLVTGAPPIELRHNLSLYRSSVQGIPGPDNRLDSQAPASANVGADYRLRGTPFTLGGNVNWVPGYRTQVAVDRVTLVSTKVVWDAFGLWTIDPALALRLTLSNLAPRDYESSNEFTTATTRETARSTSPSYTNVQLRLELKL